MKNGLRRRIVQSEDSATNPLLPLRSTEVEPPPTAKNPIFYSFNQVHDMTILGETTHSDGRWVVKKQD